MKKCGCIGKKLTHSFSKEIHSKLSERENFRQISYIRLTCVKTITGHGTDGYLEAIDYLTEGK